MLVQRRSCRCPGLRPAIFVVTLGAGRTMTPVGQSVTVDVCGPFMLLAAGLALRMCRFAAGVVAIARTIDDCAVATDAQRGGERIVLALEQRIVGNCLLYLLVEFERGQLQQPDRLLQLWRQRQMLREFELKARFHAGYGA